jgi:hypothetical protein
MILVLLDFLKSSLCPVVWTLGAVPCFPGTERSPVARWSLRCLSLRSSLSAVLLAFFIYHYSTWLSQLTFELVAPLAVTVKLRISPFNSQFLLYVPGGLLGLYMSVLIYLFGRLRLSSMSHGLCLL